MPNETNSHFVFGAINKRNSFERTHDDNSTVIYSSKEPKKLPLLAVVGFGFFATSPVLDYTMTEQTRASNPIVCLSKAVSRMEQATSLAFDNGSLESFLHKSVHESSAVAAQESEVAEAYTETLLHTYSDFDFSSEQEFSVELNVVSIEEEDFSFDEDDLVLNTSHAIV